MEAFALAILSVILGTQGALWYKLGRVESKLDAHVTYHNGGTHEQRDSH